MLKVNALCFDVGLLIQIRVRNLLVVPASTHAPMELASANHLFVIKYQIVLINLTNFVVLVSMDELWVLKFTRGGG